MDQDDDEQPVALRGKVRRKEWTRVSHGLYRSADSDSNLPAWQLLLPPRGRFTHLSAAGVYGWWLPPLPEDLPVFIAVGERETRPQRGGIKVTRPRHLPAYVERDGIRLDPPAQVLLTCARHLGLIDLVVLLDSALHAGDVTIEDVNDLTKRRVRGVPRLREAATLADGRSESAWETLLRLLHVSCQVPVVPQHVLLDEHGSFVARADLWVVGTNTVHEYDGADHLSVKQQKKDLPRARRLGNEAWVRRGYTSQDVLHRAVGVLRDADQSLGRLHRPERVRVWHRMLEQSLFTGSGRTALTRLLVDRSQWCRVSR